MNFFKRFFFQEDQKPPGSISKEIIEKIKKYFRESAFYPDFVNLIFYYQYFYEKLFKNYIWPNYIEKKIKEIAKEPVFLELGAYISRNKDLIPPEYQSRYIISDINFEVLKENPKEYPRIVLDFGNIPFKENTLPFLLGINVFSHILGLGNLEEIKRVIERNGRCIFIEDLALYAPGASLFFEKLNKKNYYLFDPSDYKIKIFLLDENKLHYLKESLENFFRNQIDIKKFIEEIKNLEITNQEINQLKDGLISKLGEFQILIENNIYIENPIVFSAQLLDLTIFINKFLNSLAESSKEKISHIRDSFYNFLILLRKLISEYSETIISNWQDFISSKELQLVFESLKLKVYYEIVEMESNREEIFNFQNRILQNINQKMLTQSYPDWGKFVESRNHLLNGFGLEIGVNGESFNFETGSIKYKALIITIEKAPDS